MQGDHRQIFATHLNDPGKIGQCLDVARLGLQRLDDIGEGQNVDVLADGYRHAVENCQGQRQAHCHPRTDASHALDLDTTAHGLDVPAYHVHADTTAGNIGHHLGGRETGFKYQRPDILVGHLVGNLETTLACLGKNALAIEAGTVVTDFDDDIAALVCRLEGNRTHRILADRDALLGHFNAMVETVANEVCQGISDTLDQALVELRRFTQHFQLDLLAEF